VARDAAAKQYWFYLRHVQLANTVNGYKETYKVMLNCRDYKISLEIKTNESSVVVLITNEKSISVTQ
jgi:hypothetical protein